MTGAIYTDFGHLAGLRGEAQRNPNAALEDVAAQFESLFLQQMLKSMRDATMKGGLFDSSQMDTYQQMADKQVALQLSESGGIGLARALVEQMQAKGYVPGADADPADDTKFDDQNVGKPFPITQMGQVSAPAAAIAINLDKRA